LLNKKNWRTGKAMADRERKTFKLQKLTEIEIVHGLLIKDREASIAAAFKDESIGKAED
jgi:flotillin